MNRAATKKCKRKQPQIHEQDENAKPRKCCKQKYKKQVKDKDSDTHLKLKACDADDPTRTHVEALDPATTEPLYDFPLSQATRYIPVFGRKSGSSRSQKPATLGSDDGEKKEDKGWMNDDTPPHKERSVTEDVKYTALTSRVDQMDLGSAVDETSDVLYPLKEEPTGGIDPARPTDNTSDYHQKTEPRCLPAGDNEHTVSDNDNVTVTNEQPELVQEKPEVDQDKTEPIQKKLETVQEKPEQVQRKSEMVHEKSELMPEESELVQEKLEHAQDISELAPENAELVQQKLETVQENTELVQQKPELVHKNLEFVQRKPETVQEPQAQNKPEPIEKNPDLVQKKPELLPEKHKHVPGKPDLAQEKPNTVQEMSIKPETVQENPELDQEKPETVQEKPDFVQEKPQPVSEKMQGLDILEIVLVKPAQPKQEGSSTDCNEGVIETSEDLNVVSTEGHQSRVGGGRSVGECLGKGSGRWVEDRVDTFPASSTVSLSRTPLSPSVAAAMTSLDMGHSDGQVDSSRTENITVVTREPTGCIDDTSELTDSQLCQFIDDDRPVSNERYLKRYLNATDSTSVVNPPKNLDGTTEIQRVVKELTTINKMLIQRCRDIEQMKRQRQQRMRHT